MRLARVGLIGFLGALVATVGVIAFGIATAPPSPPTGLNLIELPMHRMGLFAVIGFTIGCWRQRRRERRRIKQS
jgi:hypothetical protein